jgi:hypothetical protein
VVEDRVAKERAVKSEKFRFKPPQLAVGYVSRLQSNVKQAPRVDDRGANSSSDEEQEEMNEEEKREVLDEEVSAEDGSQSIGSDDCECHGLHDPIFS